MAAVQTATSWNEIARRIFRRTPPQHVRGEGRFALIIKCGVPWRVLLYDTAEARQQKLDGMVFCSSPNCGGDHQTYDLHA